MTGVYVRWWNWLLPWGISASEIARIPFHGRDDLVAHIRNSRARLADSVVSPVVAKMKNHEKQEVACYCQIYVSLFNGRFRVFCLAGALGHVPKTSEILSHKSSC